MPTKPKSAALPEGLRVNGHRATNLIPIPRNVFDAKAFSSRVSMRLMPIDEFIETRGSGTLRKNKRIGMNVSSRALAERVAYEFGYTFEACPERFVTWGEPRSEADCKPLTEAGWFIERYASVSLFPGDEVEAKYLIVENDGRKREGVGLIVRTTSAPWIPKGYTVFCFITTLDPHSHDFEEAKNPC